MQCPIRTSTCIVLVHVIYLVMVRRATTGEQEGCVFPNLVNLYFFRTISPPVVQEKEPSTIESAVLGSAVWNKWKLKGLNLFQLTHILTIHFHGEKEHMPPSSIS